MAFLLPFTFLFACFSVFGLFWIIWEFDPQSAPWYIFAALVFCIFVFAWSLLGLLIYFLRTRRYRRYSANWYFKTSFKLAFFAALFCAIVSTLAVIRIINFFNLAAAVLAVILLMVWAYMGKRIKS